MRRAVIAAIVVAFGLFSRGIAEDDASILFSDDFASFNPAWGRQSELLQVADHKLVIRSEPHSTYTQFNNRLKVDDADIRVRIRLAEGGAERGAGIVFWAADAVNWYAAIIKADGHVDVIRQAGGEPFIINAPKIQAAVQQGVGQVNELRVVTKGRWAAVYVNDQRIWLFQGFPPAGASQFGVRGGSADRSYTWEFSDFAVRKPDPSLLPATPAVADPTLLYSDDFALFDAGWGEPNERMWVASNRLMMRPSVNSFHAEFYAGAEFTDADVRVKIRAAEGGLDGPAGIVFWATEFQNHYRVLVEPDGYMAVFRQTPDERQIVLDWSEQPAVNQGIGQINELRVVTQGEWAAIYVNDRPVFTFQGYPPEEPGLIGLIANSGNEASTTWQFFDLRVYKPAADFFQDRVLYAADFSTPNSGWGEADYNHYFENNDFVFRPNRDGFYTQLYGYENVTFRDVDVRVMVCEVAGGNDKGVGIAFWATTFEECYVAMLLPDGRVGISRHTQGKWLSPGPWTVQTAVKQGLNQWNELRVVTRGRWAAIYVNDALVCKFQGFPPAGSSYVGLHAASGPQVYTWAFANFVVRKPDESLLPATTPWSATDPTVLFADRFQTLDPAWGAADDQLRVERNGLIVESIADRAYTPLYRGNFFGDCDIRVKVSEVNGGLDKPAGIAFWAEDYGSYYVAQIRSDGRFGVWRYHAEAWQVAVEPKVVDAVKPGLNEENELRVVTRGTTATVYVNGTRVASFAGDPPPGGGIVGLHAESGGTPYRWRFTDFSVRQSTPDSSDQNGTTVAPAVESNFGSAAVVFAPTEADAAARAWLKGDANEWRNVDLRDFEVKCIWHGAATLTDAAGEYWSATVPLAPCEAGNYLAVAHADDDEALNVQLYSGQTPVLMNLIAPTDKWAQCDLTVLATSNDVRVTVAGPHRDAKIALYLYKAIKPIGIKP